MTPTKMGHFSERLIQDKLWQYGYSVQKFTRGYDLFINGKYTMEVKSTTYKKNTFCFACFGEQHPLSGNQCDFYGFVFWYPDKTNLLRFASKESVLAHLEATEQSSKNSLRFKSPNDLSLEKSPLELLGNPKDKSITHFLLDNKSRACTEIGGKSCNDYRVVSCKQCVDFLENSKEKFNRSSMFKKSLIIN